MLRFRCPNCRQELEADDDIRGQQMPCPSCRKAIQVPEKLPGRGRKGTVPSEVGGVRRGGASFSSYSPAPTSSGRGVGVALLVSVIALASFLGVAFLIRSAASPSRNCAACLGTTVSACESCRGTGRASCRECGGDGQRTNLKNAQEDCYVCNASGKTACPVCGGTAKQHCKECLKESKNSTP